METCKPDKKKLLLLLLYMSLVMMGSLIPMDRQISGLRLIIAMKPVLQNLLHIPMFAVLSILLLQVLSGYDMTPLKRAAVLLGVAISFGVVNEMIQVIIPGRYAGMLDMVLNLIGIFSGILLYKVLSRTNPNFLRRLVCG